MYKINQQYILTDSGYIKVNLQVIESDEGLPKFIIPSDDGPWAERQRYEQIISENFDNIQHAKEYVDSKLAQIKSVIQTIRETKDNLDSTIYEF